MRYGLWGSEYTTQYEIASLSKTMTASLLLEAIRRGEVTAQTPVSALVPEIVSPVRDVTLEQLVSHRSGLPPLTASVGQRLAILSDIARRQNPWRYDRPALIAMMNQATLQPTKWFDYSNAGFALLGLALERASHRDFATLMAQRVFAPTGMQGAEVARHNTPASPTFTMGWSASGFPQQPWVMDAFAPPAASAPRLSIWRNMPRRCWQETWRAVKACTPCSPPMIPIPGWVMPGSLPASADGRSSGMTGRVAALRQ
ncbi:beta-lactamase family protein [Klebsiella variicola subsp. variicola]|nr:beta-lactamase family protein [Klebsiella variicola subsp. variicola]